MEKGRLIQPLAQRRSDQMNYAIGVDLGGTKPGAVARLSRRARCERTQWALLHSRATAPNYFSKDRTRIELPESSGLAKERQTSNS